MDLHHPLRSLIPSLDWAVLEVLAGSHSGLGASQIARLSHRGTRAGQDPVLRRLVEHGLVLAEPANQGYLYRLNRDHLLAPAVLLGAELRTEVLRRLAGEVERFAPAVLHASVFGSFARGEADESSDIDVLLLAASEPVVDNWAEPIRAMRERMELWTGNACNILPLTVDRARELAIAHEPIVTNWLNDELVIFGDPLRDLLDAQGGEGTGLARAQRSRVC